MDTFDRSAFEAETERLGLAAVAAIGSDNYPTAFRRLMQTFKNGYFFYLMDVYKLSLRFLDQNEILNKRDTLSPDKEKRMEKVYAYYDDALAHMPEYLSAVINNFDPSKSADGAENAFFAYLTRYFYLSAKQTISDVKAEDSHLGMTELFTRNEREKNQKILKYLDSIGHREWAEKANAEHYRIIAEALQLDPKKVQELLKKNYQAAPVDSIVLLDDEEIDLIEKIEGFDLTPEERLLEPGKPSRPTDFRKVLRCLNEVYLDSFQEVHRTVFPPCWTSEYIKTIVMGVKEKHRDERTLQSTIDHHWNEFMLDKRKGSYATGEYYCICEYVFSWFEESRKLIADKQIAEHLNMNPPRLNKKYKEAYEVAMKRLRQECYRTAE